MSTHEFSFAIELSVQTAPEDMLRDLVSRVLNHVGCACEVVPGIVDALQGAVMRTGTNGGDRCSVRFTAHGGELQIDVSSGARSVWNVSQPIS